MSLPAQPNLSLIDGLAVLQAVIARPDAVGSRELGRELDLEPTRVNRLLKTLAHLGLTEQLPNRKYRSGPAIHVLAAQSLFSSGLLRQAIPHLEALHQHGLIVAMGVLWRNYVSYLYHAEPNMSTAQALGRTGLYPAFNSGVGIALLATSADLRQIPPKARKHARDAREKGYAYLATSEHTYSLGVIVPNTTTAIALSGKIKQNDVPQLVPSLQEAAQQIADALA